MAKPLLGHRSTEGDPSVVPAAGRTIGVLGSGDFARSLAIRLVCSGFKVVVGSRNPKRKACLFPPAAEVTFQAEAVKKTDVIFVAVFRELPDTSSLRSALVSATLRAASCESAGARRPPAGPRGRAAA